MAYYPNILSALSGGNYWDKYDFPARLMDQNFGVGLYDDDLQPPSMHRGYMLRPRTQQCYDASGQSEVKSHEDKFEVSLDVAQFEPEELSVKIVDNFIVVHAKHEEKPDPHGYIAREFTRKYILPDGVEAEEVKSSLTSDGVLRIQAPRKIEKPETRERKVPITLE